jgi:hypothetical protein
MNLNLPGYTGTGGGATIGGGLNLPGDAPFGYSGFNPMQDAASLNQQLQGIGVDTSGGGLSGFGQIAGGIGDIFGGLMGAGQQVLGSPNALMGLAGGLLTKEAYDRLSNVGEQAKREAMGVAERGQMESTFKPFTVTTPTGAMFTSRMGGQPSMGQPMAQPVGQPSMMLPPGFTQLSGDISATDSLKDAMSAGTIPRLPSAYDGMGDQLRDILGLAPGKALPTGPFVEHTSYMPPGLPQPTTGGLEVGMTLSPQEQAMQQQLLGGAGGFFGQAAQPTVDREQAIFDRMRAAQRPEEERQRLALEERLAAQGRLGTSSAAYGGATPELLALSTAEREARDRSMLTAMQQAQAEQAQQAALGGQFLGAGYLPQQQLISAAQPGLIQQELAQQAQQFGTGLFGETALSGIEAQLLAEQARANLLGGVGSNVISGLINQQRAASAAPSGGGGSSLGGLFSTIAGGLGNIGSGIKNILNPGG